MPGWIWDSNDPSKGILIKMTITSIAIGSIVLAFCFGLMVWGKNYLGEEAGRNPKNPEQDNNGETINPPCRKCGSCGNESDQ
jgi:hypothetical protein